MKLEFSDVGEGPALVVLHGLFGSRRNWASFAKSLSAHRRVVSVDLRNHGDSPWDDAMGYPAMAEDLFALFAAAGLDRPALLGHSMGGKVAMTAALLAPEAIGQLIVADIAPVAYPHRHEPYIDAMRAIDLGAVTRRGEADAALAAAVPEPGLRAFLLQNLVFGDGGPRWRINLDAIAAAMPDLTGWPAPPSGAVFDGPALFIGGSLSRYVAPDSHPAIRTLFPAARIETLAGAGHWLHAERPDAFREAVTRFLDGAG